MPKNARSYTEIEKQTDLQAFKDSVNDFFKEVTEVR